MSQAPTNRENSKNLKPIDLKIGNCSGAKFYIRTEEEGTVLRKEFKGNTKKLKEQFNWLNDHRHLDFIPPVSNPIESVDSFSYEMPFYENAKNAHESIDSITEEVFSKILSSIDALIVKGPKVNETDVNKYFELKLQKKIRQCFQNQKARSISDKNIIEDKEYHSIEEIMTRLESKRDLLKFGEQSEIHGDLTLENIIIDNSKPIFIDPNGENIISTIEVEFAKLFQSLNSSYEDLSLGNTTISQLLLREEHPLLTNFKRYIVKRYGEESLIRVYFHELIHLARLLPYKQINLGHQYDVFLDLFIIRSTQFLKTVKGL